MKLPKPTARPDARPHRVSPLDVFNKLGMGEVHKDESEFDVVLVFAQSALRITEATSYKRRLRDAARLVGLAMRGRMYAPLVASRRLSGTVEIAVAEDAVLSVAASSGVSTWVR